MTREWVVTLTLAAAVAAAAAAPVRAQTPAAQTGSITGTVADATGTVVTGAAVSVRHEGSGATRQVFTNLQGAFSVTPLEPGEYTVTATRFGYQPGITKAAVAAGAATAVKIVLELRDLPAPDMGLPRVLTADFLNQLPMPVRNALDAVTFLPGVTSYDINRASLINGLHGAFTSMAFDGVPNNDMYEKSSAGLAAGTTARLDAIDQVAATLLLAPVQAGGASDIAMRTRSGSDRFAGSAYQALRLGGLSGNDWFSENAGQPESDQGLSQFGVRQGGPIRMFGDGKAFFFFNYETLRRSGTVSRSRTVLNPLTQTGHFRYLVSSGGSLIARDVNVLLLPGAAGFGATPDPTVASLLSQITASTGRTDLDGHPVNGRLSQTADLNLLLYEWQSPIRDVEHQPVARVDANLTSKHRLGVTYAWDSISRDADFLGGHDVQFPGLANSGNYESRRPLLGATLRSSLTDTVLNEFTIGLRSDTWDFGSEATNGPASFAGTNGYALGLGFGLSNAHGANSITGRTADVWSIRNVVNWQRGRHGFAVGGSVLFNSGTVTERQVVPEIQFGVDAADPALALFNSVNLPGASAAQRAAAASLFALLTGRVSGIGSYATLNRDTNAYELLGRRYMAGRQNELALFAQDDFRVSQKVTLTAGVRWTLQKPFSSQSNTMAAPAFADVCGITGVLSSGGCRFYQTGSTEGDLPRFQPFGPDARRYDLDLYNFAPVVGFAWRPGAEDGFWRNVFGDPEQATIRLGYSQAFAREGLGLFLDQFGLNAGSRLNVGRSARYGNLIPAGENYPLFLQQANRLGPAAFPATGAFPADARPGAVDDIGSFAPNISIGRATTMTAGLLRPISPDMTAEVRWVRTQGESLWGIENYNEIDVFQNRFFDEFRLAMINLEENIAAGRGATFAYFGPGSRTAPLPVFLGYLTGQAGATAGDPARYTGVDWTNLDLIRRLSVHNPDPYGAAADLHGDALRRANAITAGLPQNYFMLNPDVGQALMYDSKGSMWRDAIQVDVQRRLSRGLQVSANYQYTWAMASKFISQRFGYVTDPAPVVRQTIKAQGVWMAPYGFAVSGVARLQARTVDFGNVRLVGMTSAQLSSEYGFRVVDDPLNPGRQIVTMLPADIILNTQRAFSVDPASPTGYSGLGAPEGRYLAPANSSSCIQIAPGDCAARSLIVQAPWLTRVDLSIAKAFALGGRVSAELRLDLFNLLNAVNYTPVANPGGSPTIFQVTSAYSDLNTYDSGARMGQIVWRIKW
jgi:hypothetical protein